MSQAEESTIKAIFEFVDNDPIDATFTINQNVRDLNYTHYQDSPSAKWTIQHNLNKFPSVTVVSSAGDAVFADVKYIDNNNVELNFSAAFGGRAYCN
jgi:hypothetical protein